MVEKKPPKVIPKKTPPKKPVTRVKKTPKKTPSGSLQSKYGSGDPIEIAEKACKQGNYTDAIKVLEKAPDSPKNLFYSYGPMWRQRIFPKQESSPAPIRAMMPLPSCCGDVFR